MILVSLAATRSFVEIEIFVVQLPRKEHLAEIDLDGYFRLLLYNECSEVADTRIQTFREHSSLAKASSFEYSSECHWLFS